MGDARGLDAGENTLHAGWMADLRRRGKARGRGGGPAATVAGEYGAGALRRSGGLALAFGRLSQLLSLVPRRHGASQIRLATCSADVIPWRA
jgi:hypothetical protein